MIAANPQNSYDALAWQAEMGVDLCVEDAPQVLKAEVAPGREAGGTPPPSGGRLGGGLTQAVPPSSTPHLTSPPRGEELPLRDVPASRSNSPPPSSLLEAIAEARTLADNAQTLAELEAAVRNFNGCSLKKTATNTVFAQGVPESRLMFIGEAPGADEDRKGVPFCGPSGQLLDRMLSFIDRTRAENFYITNTLFWRPPGNRQPSKEELEICRPFVEKHIALVDPKILVLVGGTATSSMLGETRGITRLRGQIFSYKNDYMATPVPVHVLYHPSYLLRQPLAKKQAWGDLLALNQALSVA